MLACPIVAGICLERATRERKTDELAAAVAELEREIGAAFEPILRRMARQLERWSLAVGKDKP